MGDFLQGVARTDAAFSDSPRLGWPTAELVLISEFQKRLLQIDGVVHPSPIDIQQFSPRSGRPDGPFTVGRLSRDTPTKHHADDVPLYKTLLAKGDAVRIQGGVCLKEMLAPHPRLELLPAGRLGAVELLRSLDVFYYYTGSHLETFGRVVLEAMACGLPVVCHSNGGYADHIRHGENGFLFDTIDQATRLIADLRADAELREKVGRKARQTVEEVYSPSALRQRLDFYLR